LGRAGSVAHHLARILGGTERTRATELERIVSGRQFRSGQKRGSKVGKTKRGKGTKWMVVVDGQGVPLGNQLYSASPNEVRLAEETLASVRVTRRHRGGRPRQKVQRVIADRAYDSDPLRARLAARGIELIAPHRWNRSKPRTQDGRTLRRYRRRWKVERTLAWLGNFRRPLTTLAIVPIRSRSSTTVRRRSSRQRRATGIRFEALCRIVCSARCTTLEARTLTVDGVRISPSP
jgi:transposase